MRAEAQRESAAVAAPALDDLTGGSAWGQILAVAEERDLIARNPVRVNTGNRKLKTKRRRRVFLDSADQIVAMMTRRPNSTPSRRPGPPAAAR
jgi:hypothetical protein